MFHSNGSFDDIVIKLQSDDPRFSARVRRIADNGPLTTARLGVLTVAWALGGAFFVALAGWPGIVGATLLGGLLFWLRRG